MDGNGRFERIFRSPYAVPNGIAACPDGVWVVDQITDRVALVSLDTPNDYQVTHFLKDYPSDSSNTSGLSWHDGDLWLAANGSSDLWRPSREQDARKGAGEVLRMDTDTGELKERRLLPGGGGTHGIEVDCRDPDYIWLSTLSRQTLSRVRIADWSVAATIPLQHDRSHGLVSTEEALWIVYTNERTIVETNPDTGEPGRTINIPDDMPQPHGMTRQGADFLYCDATSGWIVRVHDAINI
ncbi:MAG: hypothetical protein OXG36_06535 [Caldilineaceae bacterium]|nr:hypothetical protein [Caldilineaceae bacterium]